MQQVFWFLITIAVLIPIHEYGHYRVAVACNVKVLRFSIGFGRVLFRRRFGRDGAEFVLSALPLGGYVRMLDEREAPVDAAEAERAFNRRPLWQRAAVVAAGPAANLLLALAIYAFVQWHGAEQPAPVLGTPAAGSLMAQAGVRSGDRVLALAEGASPDEGDWRDVRAFGEIYDALGQAMLDRETLQLRVVHAGETASQAVRIDLDGLDPDQPESYSRVGLGAPLASARIDDVQPGDAGSAAGLRAGDMVQQVDGRPVADAQALRELILASGRGNAPSPMRWQVLRGAQVLSLAVTPRMTEVPGGDERVARVGIGFAPYQRVLVRDEPLAALREGAVQTWRTASGSLRMFGRMVIGQASLKNLSGPGTIAEVAAVSAHQGLMPFLSFLAMMSVSLGVLNLLPIPMLDGGMLLYYLFEGATGRPVSELWQVWLQRGGALILLLLISIALSNDVARHLGLQ